MSKFTLLLAIALAFAACSSDTEIAVPIEEQVLGSWERIAWPNTSVSPGIDDSWQFESDGKAIWRVPSFNGEIVHELSYRIDREEEMILFDNGQGFQFQCFVSFKEGGSHMILTEDGAESHYTRDE